LASFFSIVISPSSLVKANHFALPNSGATAESRLFDLIGIAIIPIPFKRL
jgi:hypothetical protein